MTATNVGPEAKLTLRFKHGPDPEWRDISLLTDITEDTVAPVYCNGAFQVEVTGTSTEPVYFTMHPIVSRDN